MTQAARKAKSGANSGKAKRVLDEQIDEAEQESFPASDPPASTPTKSGGPQRRRPREASSKR